jgi:hypothetical protein
MMMDARQLRLVERVNKALAHMGTHELSDVIALAHDRKAQIWEGDDALVVTELNDYPLCRVLRYWVIAGSLEGAFAIQPRIEAWGREHGATVADAIGRRGWERTPRQPGWEHVAGYWRKGLTS